ncbi:N-formylglutamate amidohydrolase [Pelagerythrobacter marensis]|uniref:N-formylglutamate amidohydrolase n=1 Tax=Pelagerythrobacter marensis TaxID=543877 RepID=A0ABZ2D0A2_9SPHN
MNGQRSASDPGGTVFGGAIPGTGAGEPAFELHLPADTPIPVLVAAPHAGRVYPPDLYEYMRDPGYSAPRLEDRHVDILAREIAAATGAGLLVAHAPRAMLDLNRACDDVDWSMVRGPAPGPVRHSLHNRRSRSGLGLVPRRLGGLGEIWKGPIARAELDARIAQIHRPYHRALAGALDSLRDRWGAALLLDLHSMPPLRPRVPGDRPAEFVVGDRFGAACDHALSAQALAYLARCDRRAAHNRPYAGGYILDRHAAPRRGLHAIQLELCRTTYLDAAFAEPSARAPAIVRLLTGLVRELGDAVAALGRGTAQPLAAE